LEEEVPLLSCADSNERTLEKMGARPCEPNPQAAALMLLVRDYPDTLTRLEKLAG
jgi:hypothetical protein